MKVKILKNVVLGPRILHAGEVHDLKAQEASVLISQGRAEEVKPEGGSQKPEGGSQKPEGGSQKPEGGSQKPGK